MKGFQIKLKEQFSERMKILLGSEFDEFAKSLEGRPFTSIRVNELKISPEELVKRLEEKGWKIRRPFSEHKEIIIIEGKYLDTNIIPLEPGEIGRTLEHLLGYYYVQEISSMLPVIALNPLENERVLDLCASPGSKTTQIASLMKNTGLIIANEVNLGRIKILSSNLERCGAGNVIITRQDGAILCDKLLKEGFMFDKILVDAPCSGEGTLRTNPKTAEMWNYNGIKKMSFIQKRLLVSAMKVLKVGGEIVYSTCTYAPEEDEEVIDFVLEKFDSIKIESITLPVKCRQGITKWDDKDYNKELAKSCRIYPHVANTEGFFIAKMRKTK
ncbi:MAG: RsmB/NOP family class I SAM-dependent RNA methyltransferase [Candidatus Nanoarchaeia archaeon]|nr:RsmB/NOP family class I SAM-dependent RNA methyltransferase [Candidatus Nanoarchaeia archaeon]